MITRHFVTLGDQQVHLRRAGEGAPVILLHDLPNSSRLLIPAIEMVAAAGFTALAPDLSGYGNSDPLIGGATIAACAAVIERMADALGLDRFALYGGHTGALVAAEVASRSPTRVAATILNGYPLFDPDERAEYRAKFFTSVGPNWDGAHLAWLWARMREQMIFFPWHSAGAANRLPYDLPPPEVLQGRALDWLRGVRGHGGLYKAAFDQDPLPPLMTLPPYSILAYWDQDVLGPHRHRLPPLPEGVRTEVVTGDRTAVFARLEGWLDAARDLPPAPPARPAAAPPHRLIQDFAQTPAGSLAVRKVAAPGKPILLLHDAGGSSALLEDLIAELGRQRPVWAPDLPGHGESPSPSTPDLQGYLAPLLCLLDEGPMDIIGLGLGAALAIELALARPERAASVWVSGLAPLPEGLVADLISEGAPSIAARWDGGHLLTAWHRTRDGELFWPWFRRGRAGVRSGEPRVEPALLQRAVTELLKAGDDYPEAWRQWARYPAAERASALAAPPSVLTWPDDPLRPWLDAWAGVTIHRLSGPPAESAAQLLALINR